MRRHEFQLSLDCPHSKLTHYQRMGLGEWTRKRILRINLSSFNIFFESLTNFRSTGL